MLLSALVDEYVEHMPAGIVLDGAQITRNARKAVRFYCGYATLLGAPSAAQQQQQDFMDAGQCPPYILTADANSPVDASDEIAGAQDFDLTPSEWAIIRPLFDLYVELENATSLEASRALGVELYGRSTAEVKADITLMEADMPKAAFVEPVVSI